MAKKIAIDIEVVEEMIRQGDSVKTIAKKLNIGLTTFKKFRKDPTHSARVSEAFTDSAEAYDEKAEEVLLNAKSNSVEIQRARELAQHYRWRAKVRSPKIYGDKVDVTTDGKSIPAPIIELTKVDNRNSD